MHFENIKGEKMIAYLVGEITLKEEGYVNIETNGVGYELQVSNQTLSMLPCVNETTKILTYMQVKEDSITLIGFASIEEKNIFLKLITISGIGPKVALSILSGIKFSELTIAILKDDVGLLSRVKGIGKKTAERICLELKDKISPIGFSLNENDDFVDNTPAIEESIDALVSLGLSKNEATRLARESSKSFKDTPNIVSNALRLMNR